MNDFKSCYQAAVQDMDMLGMKEFHIDASACMDVRNHKKRVVKHMQRVSAAAFSTVCVVFLCGFGTVKAAEYIENVIKVNTWGFESADAVTMARNEAEDNQTFVIGEEVAGQSVVIGEEAAGQSGTAESDSTLPPQGEAAAGTEAMSGGEASGVMQAAQAEAGGVGAAQAETALQADSAGAAAQAGAALQADSAGAAAQAGAALQADSAGAAAQAGAALQAKAVGTADQAAASGIAEDQAAAAEVKTEEIPVKNYTSLEEFEKDEDIIFPQPSTGIGEKIERTEITVCGDWAMIRYDADGKVLWMERTDYAETEGHVSSKVFPNGVCNERSYTTPQGYTYTLVDSVKEKEGDSLQIHAAVTVGSYEAFIDFMGYTQKEAELIMDNVDLSLYE